MQRDDISSLNRKLIENIVNLKYEEAEDIFFSSLETNSTNSPDAISFIIMVIYYCTLYQPAKAVRTMELMINLQFKPTIDCYHAFMEMYLKQKSELLVLKWFNQISIAKMKHTQTSYNLLMLSYANSSPPDTGKVLKYFQEMKEKFGKVSSFAYGIIIEMYGLKLGDIDEALNWAKKMEEDGITNRDKYTKEVILKVYKIWKNKGSVEYSNKHPYMILYEFVMKNDVLNALELWRKMKYNNISYNAEVYNLMIQMLNANGKPELAIEFYESMLKENIKPSHSTLQTMITIFKRLGLDERVDEIHKNFFSF